MPAPRPAQPKRCPCCEHLTLEGRGDYDICPVCYWQDDGQDDADADAVTGGPNGELSLTLARQHYRDCGACHPHLVELVRPPLPDEVP